MAKTKSTLYVTKITTYKAGKYLKFWERKTPGRALACLPPCSPDTDKEIFRVSLLETILPFLTNQDAWFSSHGIANFIFSRGFHVAIPWMDLSKIFLSNHRGVGEYNSIQFILVSLSSMYFFLFQSLDVRALENLSAS